MKYYHGRSNPWSALALMSENPQVGLSYSGIEKGHGGTIYVLDAENLPYGTIVVDLSSKYSVDYGNFVRNLRKARRPDGVSPRMLADAFCPVDIVGSGDGYDQPDWYDYIPYMIDDAGRDWPDVIITPDGCVVIDPAEKVENGVLKPISAAQIYWSNRWF